MTATTRSFSGKHGDYRWFQSPNGFLSGLIRRVPQLVIGRFVAVISFDSGPFRPSEHEVQLGWTSVDEVAYSPRVTAPEDLPYDQYDEWYVFSHPTTVGSPEDFVNYGLFHLRDPA